MKLHRRFLPEARALRFVTVVLVAVASPFAHAATLWTNANVTYIQPSPGAADVLIPGKVSLARANAGPLYNPAAGETSSNLSTSPTDTMWAFGDLANFASLSYVTFASLRAAPAGFNLSSVLTNKPMVVHLLNEDIYLAVKFTYWIKGSHTGSGFAYVRSTPAPSGIPTVSLTSPAAASLFAAPAAVKLAANASVGIGTVTNVEYFAGTDSLGNATVSPYSVTGSIAAAGPYALKAVATAAGVSSTSAVVNITVANAPIVALTNPAPGSVFAAPASLKLSARVTVAGGAVPIVTFYRSASSLGTVAAPPYNLTTVPFAVGTYALTAVARASGLSTTSSVVSVSVVTPAAVSASAPRIADGQFLFSYTANTGLTYVVQSSADLALWTPVVTNVPVSSPVPFGDSFDSNSWRFYRVARLPNP